MPKLIKFNFLTTLLVVIFLMSIGLFFSPELRQIPREFFAPPERKVLSVATGKVLPNSLARVLKISTPKKIIIEVYDTSLSGDESRIDVITIDDRVDGFFQFQGRATNLALKDMDGDSVFEIIAPTFDANLIPRLNIFRFNVDSKKFEPYIE